MINQQSQKSAKTQLHFTVLGVSLFLMGLSQAMLALGRDFIDAQQPIDWAHWLSLVGVVGAAISVARMTAGAVGKAARVLIILGAIAFIGMVAIDVLLWTVAKDPAVDAALDDALDSPGVAIPFLWVGPSLFFIGLALKGLEWWKSSAWAAALLITGTFICGYGQATSARMVVVAGFVAMIVGVTGICLKIMKSTAPKS